jgi:small subunit ribosomal protein S16
MTTRIRLRRMGSNKRPFFRVVVADQRSPRDGRFIENIGRYHPLEDPSVIEIDQDRALHWLRVGAQPSNQVRNLMQKIGIWERFVQERPSAALAPTKLRPEKPKLSKKAKQRADAAASQPEIDADAAEAVEAVAAAPAEEAPDEGAPAGAPSDEGSADRGPADEDA